MKVCNIKNIIFITIVLSAGCIANPLFIDLPQAHYIIGVHRCAGFFCSFMEVIGAIDILEKNKIDSFSVNFERNGLYYDEKYGENFWEYYFEPINTDRKFSGISKKLPAESIFAEYARAKLPFKRGREIIDRYIKIKPHIKSKVERFENKNFKDHYVIAVHYRGTDKSAEVPRVQYGVFLTVIKECLKKIDVPVKIFVASDELKFIKFLRTNFPKKIVYCPVYRSNNMNPIHFCNRKNIYANGESVLIDCLLMARSNLLVCNSSYINLAAQHFNPDLNVIRLK